MTEFVKLKCVQKWHPPPYEMFELQESLSDNFGKHDSFLSVQFSLSSLSALIIWIQGN